MKGNVDRAPLGYAAKWFYNNPETGKRSELNKTDCYAYCRGFPFKYGGGVIPDGWAYTHVTSGFHYSARTLTPLQVEWFWTQIVEPAIPDDLKPYIKITDGTLFDQYGGVCYKSIEIDIRNVGWEVILGLFTLARTMQEAPQCIVRAYNLKRKYPRATPDNAFYVGLTYSGVNQAGHSIMCCGYQGTKGWDTKELEAYSWKERFAKLNPKTLKQGLVDTQLHKIFKLQRSGIEDNKVKRLPPRVGQGAGDILDQENRWSGRFFNRLPYLTEYIRMVR